MTAVDTTTARVRGIVDASDDLAIRTIFRTSLALGRPLPDPPPAFAAYEDLCVAWYLTEGRADVRVLVDDAGVLGYAFVCTDEERYERWLRRRVPRVGLRALPAAVTSPFWRKRLRDAATLRRAPHPADAHAHVNLVPGARTGLGALALCMAIDDVCRAAGHDAWYGEVNARGRAPRRSARAGPRRGRAPGPEPHPHLGPRPARRAADRPPLPPRSPGSMTRGVAFVLPGGGSSGATQVGMLRAVLEAGIRPDLVVGCSVGALNGAFLAKRPELAQVDRLEGIWRGLSRADVFGPTDHRTLLRLARRRDHVCDPSALRRLITGFCDLRDLADAAVPLHVVTTDLDHGAARWWQRGPAADILEASACLPGLFPPVVLDGCRHVDGGVLEPVPVRRALDLDASTVYVFGDAEGMDPPTAHMHALEVLVRSFAIARFSGLPDPASMARPGQRVVVLPQADTTGIDLRDFRYTARLIDESYQRCRAALAAAA